MLLLSEGEKASKRMRGWMDEWMREGEKYLQSSTYNKYTAKRGSKQNSVVTETGGEKEIRKKERRRVGEISVFFI